MNFGSGDNHLFHFVHAMVEIELPDKGTVLLLAGLLLFGVVMPIIDLGRQFFVIVELKEVFVIQRKVARRGFAGVVDDRNESARDGFEATNGLNLDFRGVNIKVAHIEGFHEFVPLIETEHRRIFELGLFDEALKLIVTRAFTGENQLNFIAVFRNFGGLDKKSLPLFFAIAARAHNDKLAFKFGVPFDRHWLEVAAHAIGNHVARCLYFDDPFEFVADELRRIMDGVHVLIKVFVEILVDRLIDSGIAHPVKEVGRDVFGLNMETSRHWLAEFGAKFDRFPAESKRHHDMDFIRVMDGTRHRHRVALSQRDAIMIDDRLKDTEVESRNHVIIVHAFLIGIRAKNANRVAFLGQIVY